MGDRTFGEQTPSESVIHSERMIRQELQCLLHYDALENPTPPIGESTPSEKDLEAYLRRHPLERFEKAELAGADALITEELKTMTMEGLTPAMDDAEYSQVWQQRSQDLVYIDKERRFVFSEQAGRKHASADLEHHYDSLHLSTEALNKRAEKLDSKINVLTTGYKRRGQAMQRQLEDVAEQREQCERELQSFRLLAAQEQGAMHRRLDDSRTQVQTLAAREKLLQRRYQDAAHELDALRRSAYAKAVAASSLSTTTGFQSAGLLADQMPADEVPSTEEAAEPDPAVPGVGVQQPVEVSTTSLPLVETIAMSETEAVTSTPDIPAAAE